jgi:RNA polymerase sigma-70 factor (ECF subfamily)
LPEQNGLLALLTERIMSGPMAKAHLRLVDQSHLPDPAGPRRVLSDEAVLAAILRGDATLSAEICEHLVVVVDRTLVRVLGRREADHDDLIQASLEQIVLTIYRRKFSQRCSLSTWAAAIASNIALHAIRKRRTERRLFDAFEDVEEAAPSVRRPTNPEATFMARQELQRVRLHLSAMSERLSRTLVLHDVLGCDLEETASIMGVSAAAAQSRLSRGRRELGRRLQKEEKQRRELS